MAINVTILGCGASTGVPVIGCDCAICHSTDPKDNRTRVSLHVEVGGVGILIDTSPDLRLQALRENIRQVDAVLYTHEHGDHSHGLDDLKRFNHLKQSALTVYGDARTLELIESRFAYAFLEPNPQFGWFRAALVPQVVEPYKPFEVAGVKILPFPQEHGRITTFGYRIGDFAYSTDLNALEDKAFDALKGVHTWVVDAQTYSTPVTHSNVAQTLGWIERVQPKRAILTHMGHELSYATLKAELPKGVEPGYDGLRFTLP
jgi:phosphoribosyl 1,2-cyclic phosphate phosphodiesterase